MKIKLNYSTSRKLCALLLAFPAAAQAQSWTPAHAGGSPASAILNFNNGASSPAVAAMPASPGGGSGPSLTTTPDTETSGGWEISAGGAAAAYLGFVNVASARSKTVTSPGVLEFNTMTGGTLGSLAVVSIPSTWQASAVVTGSDSWVSLGNDFQYEFNIDLSNSVLNFTMGVFPDFGLLIEDGNGTDLYSAPTLGTLLGLGVTDLLTNSSYDRTIMVNDYDPATGPLKITWFGDHTLTGGVLNDTEENIMKVRTSEFRVQSVPEISAFWLGLLALASLLLLRRRRQPGCAS